MTVTQRVVYHVCISCLLCYNTCTRHTSTALRCWEHCVARSGHGCGGGGGVTASSRTARVGGEAARYARSGAAQASERADIAAGALRARRVRSLSFFGRSPLTRVVVVRRGAAAEVAAEVEVEAAAEAAVRTPDEQAAFEAEEAAAAAATARVWAAKEQAEAALVREMNLTDLWVAAT